MKKRRGRKEAGTAKRLGKGLEMREKAKPVRVNTSTVMGIIGI